MSSMEMVSKIKELRELKRMAEELQEEITAIEDAIKSEMTTRETEQLNIGEYKVKWTTVISKRLDSTKLKAEHADIYNLYTKETVSKRFSIA